jgi:hypothetical protein
MAREPVTREGLARALLVNAATKPLNVAVPAAVLAAAFILHAAVLLVPVALVVYAGMVAVTFFDAREAERVGQRAYALARGRPKALDTRRLSPAIVQPLEEARAEQRLIEQAIAQAKLPFADVSTEIESLLRELEKVAGRAQVVLDYLDSIDEGDLRARLRDLGERRSDDPQVAEARAQAAAAIEDQLRVHEQLGRQLERFGAQMEHLVASLGAIRGQIVRMSVTEEASVQDDVARDVRRLREEVGAVAEGMSEAYSRVDATSPTSGSGL